MYQKHMKRVDLGGTQHIYIYTYILYQYMDIIFCYCFWDFLHPPNTRTHSFKHSATDMQVGGDVTEHSQASRSALFNALVEAKGWTNPAVREQSCLR